jgi:cytochrome c oxidase subunit 6b
MGNTIAMAEQVLEQQETVQDTSEEVQENVTETEEASTEEEEEKPKITVEDVKTAPMDYRFPTTNQAKHCYTRYNEFHK